MQDISWNFYTKTKDAWEAMLTACANAKSSIDLEEYLFFNDSIGKRFLEILTQKSKEGVKVRMLCDTAGSYLFYFSSVPAKLRAEGVDIRFFNIISPWRMPSFFSWFFRDHRKILVIDDKIGFTGGVGIQEYMSEWRDTFVRVEGGIVAEMKYAFEQMWNQSANKDIVSRLLKAKYYAKGFNFLTNSPYFRKQYIRSALMDAIRSSRKYIYLTTPYFSPDRRLIRVLRLASRRGVSVRLLTPETSDVPIVDRAARTHYLSLMSSGIKIFHYKPGTIKEMTHAKTAVIDGEWATVGSFNLDHLSFFYNYEANIVSTDSVFVETLRSHFEEDIKNSSEILLNNWKNRSIWDKTRELLIMPFRSLL